MISSSIPRLAAVWCALGSSAQSVDENPQRIRRGAVSSEQPGAGFLHQQLFNLSRKQGGQQTKPSPGHEGEQSAVTTVDKYNLRPHGVHPCTLHYDTAGTRILCTLRIWWRWQIYGYNIMSIDVPWYYLFLGRYEKYNCHVDPFWYLSIYNIFYNIRKQTRVIDYVLQLYPFYFHCIVTS